MAEQMSAFDFLLFKADEDPRVRTSMTAVCVLDRVPDWRRVLQVFERGSRLIPRLREKVVAPPFSIADPVWAIDDDFDLEYHVRRVSVPGPGSVRQLLDLAQAQAMDPLDHARPLWEATLVEGMSGGKAGLVMKLNHALTDGVGGMQLELQLFDRERDPMQQPMPPPPDPDHVTREELLQQAMMTAPVTSMSLTMGAWEGWLRAATRMVTDPRAAVSGASSYVRSLVRMARPPGTKPSPALRGRSLSRRFIVLEAPLTQLKHAAKVARGSINDAYLAAIAGGLRRYHERLGQPIVALPIAIPVSLRATEGAAARNRWGPARFACPVEVTDPRERIGRIGELVRAGRAEPALDALGTLSPLVSRLPSFLIAGLSGTAVDVQASNIPGNPVVMYFAGAKRERFYGFGPLPGAAIMATMISSAGICTIGVNLDPAAVTQQTLFEESLQAGLDEVLALAGPRRRSASPSRGRRAPKPRLREATVSS